MWKRLQTVHSQIKQTRLKSLSQSTWQPSPLHPVSFQPPTHRRLLPFPVCTFVIGEDSFVITSRQFGIHSWLQCDFQRLVHGPFLEIIILFSSDSKHSLYPDSRSRTTMELSPHPNDIRSYSLINIHTVRVEVRGCTSVTCDVTTYFMCRIHRASIPLETCTNTVVFGARSSPLSFYTIKLFGGYWLIWKLIVWFRLFS